MTTTSPAPKMLLTQREAAQMLSISTRTLFTLIKSGKLRSVRIAQQRRVVQVWEEFRSQEAPYLGGVGQPTVDEAAQQQLILARFAAEPVENLRAAAFEAPPRSRHPAFDRSRL